MRQLPNHLASGTVLNQQCIFTADLRAARYVCEFHQQASVLCSDRRHTTVDDTLSAGDFGRRETHFIRVVVARSDDTTQDIAHLRLVIDKLQ